VADDRNKASPTYAPDKLPKNFVSDGDGFSREVLPPAFPFRAASAHIAYWFPVIKTPAGKGVGFELFFFDYDSDMQLAKKTLQSDGFRWTMTVDNLLISPSRIFSIDFETMQAMAKSAGALLNEPPPNLPINVDAEKLVEEYRGNEVKADAKYKGKRIIVWGKVEKVSRDLLGNAVLWFRDGPGIFDATCRPKDKDAVLLDPGMAVAFEGTVAEKELVELRIVDCVLLAYGMPEK